MIVCEYFDWICVKYVEVGCFVLIKVDLFCCVVEDGILLGFDFDGGDGC